MNFYYNSISDQRVDYKDFQKLFEHFGQNSRTLDILRNDTRGLTDGEREDMGEYLEKYIFDVRFRQIIAQSWLKIL